MIEEVPAITVSQTFSDPISSLAGVHRKFCGRIWDAKPEDYPELFSETAKDDILSRIGPLLSLQSEKKILRSFTGGADTVLTFSQLIRSRRPDASTSASTCPVAATG